MFAACIFGCISAKFAAFLGGRATAGRGHYSGAVREGCSGPTMILDYMLRKVPYAEHALGARGHGVRGGFATKGQLDLELS